MSDRSPDLIIAGGGLSGCLAALALARRRPELAILLIEQGQSFGGKHTWSFFDTDVDQKDRWLVQPLITRMWDSHDVYFPQRRRTLGLGYASISSESLDKTVRSTLRPGQYRLGAALKEIGETHVLLEGGERIEALGVVDARGAGVLPGLDLAWQKFVGRTYRCASPHRSDRPIIMDAMVEQDSGYRFVYTLPFSTTELLVEDTYYSTSPVLDVPLLRGRIDSYMNRKGWSPATLCGEEKGVLPVALGGDLSKLWTNNEPAVARLGLRGGFFHPTTGYSLPDAVRNASLLVRQAEIGSASLHAIYRQRAHALWQERAFYRMLNRLLFRAAAPSKRYRVLQHFYRLPEAPIARFYAGRSTALDKLRILSGRPPVRIGKAISVLRGQGA